MKLEFPTIAEQVATSHTIAKDAKRRGAEVTRHWDRTEYTFDDDTTLVVRGRGKSYRVEMLLP